MEYTPSTPPPAESQTAEIVPIERARFFDAIAPEYEDLWRKLHSSAKTTRIVCEEILLPVLADTSLPQAIRDRAGMVALDVWSPSYPYEHESWVRSLSYLSGGIDAKSFQKLAPGFTAEDLTSWVGDIADYEQATSRKIVHPATALSWIKGFNTGSAPDPVALQIITDWTIRAAHDTGDVIQGEKERESYQVYLFNLSCELYNDGHIDEMVFDDIINHIPRKNLRLILKNETQDEGWGGNGTAPVKRPDSFTIITEGLSGRSTFQTDSRFMIWCKKKLHDWTQAQINPTVTLPDWLAAVDRSAGKSLYKRLAAINQRSRANEKDWSVVKEGLEVFGDEILLLDEYDASMLRIAGEVHDQEIHYAIVRGVLLRRARQRDEDPEATNGIWCKDSLSMMVEGAHGIGEDHLIALAGIETRLFEAREKAEAIKSAKRKEEQRLKEQRDPKNIQKQQALADFSTTIEALRALHRSTP